MGNGSTTQGAQLGALGRPRGAGRVGMGGRFKREGMYVCLQLIHVVVWQKPTQHCKAIILQKREKIASASDGLNCELKDILKS